MSNRTWNRASRLLSTQKQPSARSRMSLRLAAAPGQTFSAVSSITRGYLRSFATISSSSVAVLPGERRAASLQSSAVCRRQTCARNTPLCEELYGKRRKAQGCQPVFPGKRTKPTCLHLGRENEGWYQLQSAA